MTHLSPLELLESTHQFPCRYVFKVIGRNEADFATRVVHAVREVLELSGEPETSARRTANGRHVAVTLELEVAAAEHVLQVYARLQRLEGLELLL
jgi:putative lipoic acid-binding regulatory protein